MKISFELKPSMLFGLILTIATGALVYVTYNMVLKQTEPEVQKCVTITKINECDRNICGVTFSDGTSGLARLPKIGEEICR